MIVAFCAHSILRKWGKIVKWLSPTLKKFWWCKNWAGCFLPPSIKNVDKVCYS